MIILEKIKILLFETREELNKEYALKNDFTDYCDLACLNLSYKLNKNKINGTIFRGYVNLPVNVEALGHDWIEVENFVVDPTADQFSISPLIFDKFHVNYHFYQKERIIKKF